MSEKSSSKWNEIGRWSLFIWGIAFVTPLLLADGIAQFNFYSWAFVGYYWLLHIGFFLAICLIVWKYHHPLVKMVAIPFMVFFGYIMFQYLQPEYLYFNPIQMVYNFILLGIAGINALGFLGALLVEIFRRRMIPKIKAVHWKKQYSVLLGCLGIYLGAMMWGYVGFSYPYVVEDTNNSNFRVGFWGSPTAGLTYANYNTPEINEEMALYKTLNTTFIFGLSWQNFLSADSVGNLTATMHEWAEWDVQFIIDCSTVFPWLNSSSGEYYYVGDFVTYYYCAQFNRTLDAIMDWASTEGFTNFRGISLDIEGPNYRNNTQSAISYDSFYAGKKSFQDKFAEFKTRFPSAIINLILMDGTIFDSIDQDPQLQVTQLTVGQDLNVDVYGYMTYMTGFATISFSSYRYAAYCEYGMKLHGAKFQPWVGWWYDNVTFDDPNQIENPVVYAQTIEQYKIAKSTGAPEVILAPIRNYIGKNRTEGMQRLQALVDIKMNGFETFSIPITNDMRIVNDWALYWKKIHPTRWLCDENSFRDSMSGTPNNWFLATQFILFSLAIFVVITRKRISLMIQRIIPTKIDNIQVSEEPFLN